MKQFALFNGSFEREKFFDVNLCLILDASREYPVLGFSYFFFVFSYVAELFMPEKNFLSHVWSL